MTTLIAEDLTILIVEDVYMVRRTLELILKSRGFKVVDAANANAASSSSVSGRGGCSLLKASGPVCISIPRPNR